MNKWQKVYCDTYYHGNVPRSVVGEEEYDLLATIGDTVTVEFPEHTDTYVVTENDCNIPEGRISVRVLASNLRLWILRGYKIRS